MKDSIKRNVYLTETPLSEAVSRFFEALDEQGVLVSAVGRTIRVDVNALGRITAAPVFAKIHLPTTTRVPWTAWPSSRSFTFAGQRAQSVTLPLMKKALTRRKGREGLCEGSYAVMVDTRRPASVRMRCRIMVEDLVHADDESVTIIAPAKPWQHVRTVGEDIVATELILPENHGIRPADLGALLAAGVTEVEVRRRPRVVIIPTGNELVAPGSQLRPGDIVEFNSQIIGGFVVECGGEPSFSPIVPDDFGDIAEAVRAAAASADIVIVNAGSSAGSEDYTSAVVEKLGRVIVNGVAIKPGKPTILGIVEGPAKGVRRHARSSACPGIPFLHRWRASCS